MDSDKEPHSQPRQNNMYSLHTRPSRIQHTTRTTNRQHHTPHEHQPKNTMTDSRPQTHIQKNTQKSQQQTYAKQYRYSKHSHQQHG